MFQKADKQENSGSLETISDSIPQPMPFPPAAVRSGSPKLDPSEVYLKSKTIFEDKRKYTDLLLEWSVAQGVGVTYIRKYRTVRGRRHLPSAPPAALLCWVLL